MGTKKTIIGLMIVIVITLLISGSWLIFHGRDQLANTREEVAYQRFRKECWDKLRNADSLVLLEELAKDIPTLKESDRRNISKYLELRFSQFHYSVAEAKIWRAKRLIETMEEESPFIERYIEEAFEHYRVAKKKIDSLMADDEDDNFNFHLYYTRGNIYYRILMFLASKEEAVGIFNQTASSWKKALSFRKKDIYTEINLEILRKNQDKLIQGQGQGQKKGDKLKMLPLLPKQGPGIGGGIPHGNF